MEAISTTLALLFFVAFMAMFIGLIRPTLVIHWGEKRTRGRVILYYGLGLIALSILVSALEPEEAKIERAEENLEKGTRLLSVARKAYDTQDFQTAIDSAGVATSALKSAKLYISEADILEGQAQAFLDSAKVALEKQISASGMEKESKNAGRDETATTGQPGKWGYINKRGEFVATPQFDWAYSFSEGLARVKIGDKYGYINTSLEYIVTPQFSKAWSFSEGLAPVYIGDKWGYINKKGKIVIKPQYDGARPFKNGLAFVQDPKTEEYGVINKSGKYVVKPQFNNLLGATFSEGLAHVYIGDRWGYIDEQGTMVIPLQFANAWPFSEGLAAVLVYK